MDMVLEKKTLKIPRFETFVQKTTLVTLSLALTIVTIF